jgi:hypothetical protein
MLSSMSAKPSDAFSRPQAKLPKLVLAAITSAALLLQLGLSIQLALASGKTVLHGVVVYFGFFTILTNILITLILVFSLSSGQNRAQRFFTRPQVMACAATSILLVGLGYHFLLRNIWNPQGLQWLADMLLHYVTPVGFCTIWIFRLTRSSLPWWSPFLWCVYPVIYLIYALVRGLFLHAYPYPFIDVTQLGYAQTLLNSLGLFAAFIIAGSLLLGITRAMGRRNQSPI